MSRDTLTGRPDGLGAVDPFTDDAAYFEMLRSRMPERDQRIMTRLDKVKSVYVECGRDRALRDAFDTFLRSNLPGADGRRRNEAEVFFLTGESGAGKSEAVGRLLAKHPAMQPFTGSFGTGSPYVSIKLKGYTHPRIAGRNIITAAGYSFGEGSQLKAPPEEERAEWQANVFAHFLMVTDNALVEDMPLLQKAVDIDAPMWVVENVRRYDAARDLFTFVGGPAYAGDPCGDCGNFSLSRQGLEMKCETCGWKVGM